MKEKFGNFKFKADTIKKLLNIATWTYLRQE